MRCLATLKTAARAILHEAFGLLMKVARDNSASDADLAALSERLKRSLKAEGLF